MEAEGGEANFPAQSIMEMDGEARSGSNAETRSSELLKIPSAFFIFMEDYIKNNHAENQKMNDALKAAKDGWDSLSLYTRLRYFSNSVMYHVNTRQDLVEWPQEPAEETDEEYDADSEKSALTPLLIFLANQFPHSSDSNYVAVIDAILVKWQSLPEMEKKPYLLVASKRLAEYEKNFIAEMEKQLIAHEDCPLLQEFESPVATGLTTYLFDSLQECHIQDKKITPDDVLSFVGRWETSLSSPEKSPFFTKAKEKMKQFENGCLSYLKNVPLTPPKSMVKRLSTIGVFD
ncbi:hypothetical protein CARUB_v10009920mg [Capsella rubella]|uniref:HMG box domain-containing protein n=1 Tax=Capsella rubella TaxID=81985 RepID=R0GMH6_9BRAS|nr:uncharacterized protein LOC17897093 [Capsella rubella]EOA36966.1 hypothetical protein CARUB_v10009920mg [Capsella rubella]